jgi:hypothetical protein
MRVERLPFTVYDIIGYLVPGIAFLWFILACAKHIGFLDEIVAVVLLGSGDYSKILGAIIFF